MWVGIDDIVVGIKDWFFCCGYYFGGLVDWGGIVFDLWVVVFVCCGWVWCWFLIGVGGELDVFGDIDYDWVWMVGGCDIKCFM